MTAESATRGAEKHGAETMTVGPNQPLLAIIVVGRATIGAALAGERDLLFIHARGTLDALGELGKIGPASPAPFVILDQVAVASEDVEDFIVAARRLNPGVRFLGIGPPAPVMGIERWASPQSSRTEWLVHIGRLPLELPRLAGTDPMREPPDAAGLPDPRGTQGEDSILMALLAGGDLLGPAMARIRDHLGALGVRLLLAAEQNPSAAASTSAHEARVEVRHRTHRFGWLAGPRELENELRGQARTLALWLALQEQHAALRSAALTDPLTGAWNRRYFDRFFESSIARAQRRRHDVTLLLFDIDNFKTYNDRFGHAAGDEILRETVRLLGSVIRPTDRVCRIGGDEFAVIFDDPDGPRDPSTHHPLSIVDIARRFQAQVREHQFPRLRAEAAGNLTITAAMTTYPWDASDAAHLLEHADRLLQESKREGKNAVNLGPGRHTN